MAEGREEEGPEEGKKERERERGRSRDVRRELNRIPHAWRGKNSVVTSIYEGRRSRKRREEQGAAGRKDEEGARARQTWYGRARLSEGQSQRADGSVKRSHRRRRRRRRARDTLFFCGAGRRRSSRPGSAKEVLVRRARRASVYLRLGEPCARQGGGDRRGGEERARGARERDTRIRAHTYVNAHAHAGGAFTERNLAWLRTAPQRRNGRSSERTRRTGRDAPRRHRLSLVARCRSRFAVRRREGVSRRVLVRSRLSTSGTFGIIHISGLSVAARCC